MSSALQSFKVGQLHCVPEQRQNVPVGIYYLWSSEPSWITKAFLSIVSTGRKFQLYQNRELNYKVERQNISLVTADFWQSDMPTHLLLTNKKGFEKKKILFLRPISAKSVRQNIILWILVQWLWICLLTWNKTMQLSVKSFTVPVAEWLKIICLCINFYRAYEEISYYLHLPNLLLVLLVSCLFYLCYMKLQTMFLNQQILHQIQKMSPQHASEKLVFISY